mgnify:CR=1 FL=1
MPVDTNWTYYYLHYSTTYLGMLQANVMQWGLNLCEIVFKWSFLSFFFIRRCFGACQIFKVSSKNTVGKHFSCTNFCIILPFFEVHNHLGLFTFWPIRRQYVGSSASPDGQDIAGMVTTYWHCHHRIPTHHNSPSFVTTLYCLKRWLYKV